MSGDETLFVLYEPLPPTTALLISPQLWARDMIHRGKQTASVRAGLRDYKAGQKLALYCSLLPWSVETTITSVRHCKFHELTKEELLAAGFNEADAATHPLLNLREFYPDVTLNSTVTLVCWGSVRGYWVSHPDEYRTFHEQMYDKLPSACG